ncbi:MAG: helix-turn-helix domain-containing protein [Deltaproteobacteria bacterium]|nr:helix-turn-helix domain-containing protein [Deltaproteobacteria bacterium]
MFEENSQNYYEILDVRQDATQNEIRQAYFRVKAAYSKDSAALYSLFDEQETQLVLERVEQAYLVLSNAEKRKEYDKVHGFLKTDELPEERAAGGSSSADNTFSFAKTAERLQADAAHQAAQNVFGGGSTLEDDTFPPMSGQMSGPAGNAASSPASGGPAPVPSLSPAVSAQRESSVQQSNDSRMFENRLGIVRRVDIVKTRAPSPELEEMITKENEFRGSFLRRVREYRGITLDELADFTKISRAYLNCLEEEEFESLPAAVFVHGFVVQAAKALKLPHEKVASSYMDHYRKTFLK